MQNKIVENLKSFAIALILALIIRTFLVQSFHIPSGSMIPTLLVGDFILVDKITYHLREPDRGDVVVFHFPLNEDVYYIKRIIGIPGDKVQVIDGKVYINGKPCKYEPAGTYSYTEKGSSYKGRLFYEFLPRKEGGEKKHLILKTGDRGDNTQVFIIPKDKYLMMGDNRNNSYDSRYWGFVDRSKIVGIARIIFFSWDGEKHLPRFNRIFKLIN
ncbi:signal peptidase I [Desulfurobacterium thermolithotrophum]|uniref:signal peptidase I n=1 Tax=Desulfurobacterium thermolithotrophum TaxID=64160 RepID=UPI001EF7C62A|nr:signal peptidase I [Desulfurobacterium thermolithotrophum]